MYEYVTGYKYIAHLYCLAVQAGLGRVNLKTLVQTRAGRKEKSSPARGRTRVFKLRAVQVCYIPIPCDKQLFLISNGGGWGWDEYCLTIN